jgi:hypothetical protein
VKKKLQAILALATIALACTDNQKVPTEMANAREGVSLNALGTQEPLFTLVTAPDLTTAQGSLLSRARGRQSSAQAQVGRLSSNARLLLKPGKAVVFQLSPTEQFVAVGKSLAERASNVVSWSGEIENMSGTVQLVLTSKGVTASIRTPKALYRIEPIGAGLHAMIKVGNLPPEDLPVLPSDTLKTSTLTSPGFLQQQNTTPFPARGSATISAATQSSFSSPLVKIDVLVAYTPSAAAATGDINGLIQLAFDESNTSYSNSGLAQAIAPVFVSQVDYSEAGRNYTQHVAALQSASDGIMDIVHTWRNQYAADVVVLIVNDNTLCGQASTILADATHAFAAVYYDCATGNYSLAHEIGHLQGVRHDRVDDPNSTNGAQYVHGYIEPNQQWRTIMAVPQDCGVAPFYCPRVQYWSNPNVIYPPTGQVMGTTQFEFDAQFLDGNKIYTAGNRTTFPVTISGPRRMQPGSTICTYTSTASGGVAPYTYLWSWQSSGGSAGGWSPSNGVFNLNAASPSNYTVTLTARAFDATGEEGIGTYPVSIDFGANGCSF